MLFIYRKYLKKYIKWLKDMMCGRRKKMQNSHHHIEVTEIVIAVDAVIVGLKMIN